MYVLPNLQASTGGFVKVLIAFQKFNLIKGSVYTAAKVKLNTTCTGSVKQQTQVLYMCVVVHTRRFIIINSVCLL